jgi:hypothetical protein
VFDVLFDVLILAACRSCFKRGVLLFVCDKLCCEMQPVSRYDGGVTAYCRGKTPKFALKEQRTQNTHTSVKIIGMYRL